MLKTNTDCKIDQEAIRADLARFIHSVIDAINNDQLIIEPPISDGEIGGERDIVSLAITLQDSLNVEEDQLTDETLLFVKHNMGLVEV